MIYATHYWCMLDLVYILAELRLASRGAKREVVRGYDAWAASWEARRRCRAEALAR